MENDALATDPKNISSNRTASISTQMTQPASVQIPAEALGISLGDFWAFVTRDYLEALAAMPTMTPIMIHKGVPDFLRPVVWVGLAQARDENLYAEFQVLLRRLDNEHGSVDGIIDKDLGRCFPSHELFMHPDGEGQKMLGQILKCYNLHDPEIGYCQGMGFIVGVLLMKMEVQDAFCVFVKYAYSAHHPSALVMLTWPQVDGESWTTLFLLKLALRTPLEDISIPAALSTSITPSTQPFQASWRRICLSLSMVHDHLRNHLST